MSPEMYNPKDILKGYAKNSVHGEHNLKDGKINAIPSKEHLDRTIFRDGEDGAFLFNEQSEKKIRSEITEKILNLGKKCNIEFWSTPEEIGRPHSALITGHPGNDVSEKERLELYKKIESDPETQALLKKINNPTKLEFKYLLLNGDNITLNAVDIPESVVSFRNNRKNLFWN